MTRMLAVLMIVALGAVAPGQVEDGAERSIRSFHVGALLHREMTGAAWPVDLVLPRVLDRDRGQQKDNETARGIFGEQILEAACGPLVASGEVHVGLNGDRLIVAGTPEQLAFVEKRLETLHAVLCGRLRFGLMQGERMLGTVSVTAGERGALLAQRLTPSMTDAGVEVAQKAQIASPEVRVIPSGLRLVLEAVPLSDGKRVLVRAALREVEFLGQERLDTASADVGGLQRPRLATWIGTGSGVLSRGEELPFTLRGPEAGRDFRLRLLDAGPAAADLGGDRLVPSGVVDLKAWRFPLPWRLPVPDDSEDGKAWPSETEEPVAVPLDQVLSLCGDEYPDNLAKLSRRWFLVGPAPSAARFTQVLSGLEASCAEAARVSYALHLDRGTAGRETIARMTGHTLLGDRQRHLMGRESTYLCGQYVEIAQESTIADPRVAAWFEGIALSWTVNRVGAGLAVEGEVVIQRGDGEASEQVFHGGATRVGTVEVPALGRVEGRFSGAVGPEWSDVLHLPGEDGTTVVLSVRLAP